MSTARHWAVWHCNRQSAPPRHRHHTWTPLLITYLSLSCDPQLSQPVTSLHCRDEDPPDISVPELQHPEPAVLRHSTLLLQRQPGQRTQRERVQHSGQHCDLSLSSGALQVVLTSPESHLVINLSVYHPSDLCLTTWHSPSTSLAIHLDTKPSYQFSSLMTFYTVISYILGCVRPLTPTFVMSNLQKLQPVSEMLVLDVQCVHDDSHDKLDHWITSSQE